MRSVYRRSLRGVLVSVRLTPGASTDRIEGIYTASDGSASLKVRVRAQPEKGKANKTLIKLMAKTLGLAQAGLSITAGAAHRSKTVLMAMPGGDEEIVRRLDKLTRTIGGDDVNE